MKPSAAMSETTVSGQGTLKGKLRWGIVTLLLLAAIVNYLDRANLSIANTTIAAEFGFSQTEIGLLLSAFLWPYALAGGQVRPQKDVLLGAGAVVGLYRANGVCQQLQLFLRSAYAAGRVRIPVLYLGN